jgi:hypothetical protein
MRQRKGEPTQERRREKPMTEKFETYFAELEGLSPEDIDRSAQRLVLQEQQSVAQLIAHLAVIAGRKVELERGYSSLFEYGVRRLGLSEGSVALRIQVARKARRFPPACAAERNGRFTPSRRTGSVSASPAAWRRT